MFSLVFRCSIFKVRGCFPFGQLIQYITNLFVCQVLFKTFFNFLFDILVFPNTRRLVSQVPVIFCFMRSSLGQLVYDTTMIQICQAFFQYFFGKLSLLGICFNATKKLHGFCAISTINFKNNMHPETSLGVHIFSIPYFLYMTICPSASPFLQHQD